MLLNRIRPVAAMVAVFGIAGTALAQSASRDPGNLTRPASNLGGYTGRQMGQIYRQSIGAGYSVSSVNRMTLNNTAANIGYFGQSRVAQDPVRRSISSPSFAISPTRSSKPFSSVTPTPTTSPYLNLFRDTISDDVYPDYNAIVRPQLQQQAINTQLQRQGLELERRVQQISAQPAFNPQGSTSQAPTGHASVFNYHGRYYPGLNTRRR